MSAPCRNSRAAALVLRAARSRTCISTISSISQRRAYAVAAEPVASTTIPKATTPPAAKAATPEISKTLSALDPYVVKSAICLSRPPLLTRELHPFESSFFFYQRRLNERLVMPFSRYFYFKKDTPADNAWKRKALTRNGSPARDLGGYNPYGELGWNDELLVGEKLDTQKATRDALVEDAVNRGLSAEEAGAEEEEIVERPLPRQTEADRKKDVRRLDRRLERTLYLVVQNQDGKWTFPSDKVVGRENLHQAAERILVQSGGPNMNTWIVGHVPIGHVVAKPWVDESGIVTKSGEKTFILKGRIMAGQADIKGNVFGIKDFKWLTREEVEGHVGPKYWSQIKNFMARR